MEEAEPPLLSRGEEEKSKGGGGPLRRDLNGIVWGEGSGEEREGKGRVERVWVGVYRGCGLVVVGKSERREEGGEGWQLKLKELESTTRVWVGGIEFGKRDRQRAGGEWAHSLSYLPYTYLPTRVSQI